MDCLDHAVAVIEDDATIRFTVGEVLQSAGYQPSLFSCAEDIIESGCLDNVRYIVTDIGLPQMSGLQLHRYLHANHPSAAVIIMTGMCPDQVRFPESGPFPFGLLYKPFHPHELLGLLDKARQPIGCQSSGG